jgi:hypothetical protein
MDLRKTSQVAISLPRTAADRIVPLLDRPASERRMMNTSTPGAD